MNGTDIICPQCGTAGTVDFARREAAGFCRTCDYPLFWARERVIPPVGDTPADSGLRRLPGTVGHAALAALACPECDEPNQPTADYCVRCGADMHPVVVVPEPEPEPEPIPEPEPEPEPERWQWWPLVAAAAFAVIVIAILLIVFNN